MFKGVTTRDVLAVLTVSAALLFNGISLVQGLPPDAATMTLAGAIVGYYFNPKQDNSVLVPQADDDDVELSPPLYGKQD